MTPAYLVGWMVGALLGQQDMWTLILGDSTAQLALVVIVLFLPILAGLVYTMWRMTEEVREVRPHRKQY